MKILEDQNEIASAQDRFKQSLASLKPETRSVTIGYQSGSVIRDVLWVPSFAIWAHFGDPPEGKSEGERYWNVFGLDKPEGMVSIVCEVNPPLRGINRRVQGAFARGDAGDVWVVHRGWFNIAGGMTKEFFRKHYREPYKALDDGKEHSEFIVIGKIGDPEYPSALSEFIHEVDRIKSLARSSSGR